MTKDAGCAKRSSDDQVFWVPNSGWPEVDGFEDCTSDETGKVMSAQPCTN